jgi:hypothetical protein
MIGYCGQNNEDVGSRKNRQFDQLCNYQSFMESFVPWSYVGR